MKKLLKIAIKLIMICLVAGIVVSIIERRPSGQKKTKTGRGWVPGHKPKGPYERYIKRPLDFTLALLALILLSPLILIVAILVRCKLGSPILFTQERPGLGGESFTLRKFRTMTDQKDTDGNLLPDEERLTGFGKLLRSTSLDELPELINILKGEMSIVGPRPLLTEYLDRYNDKQKHRHDVRPGLTGYAQAHGRNEISWEEKFEDDIKYVNNITFMRDVRIVADTVKTVVKREGIHSETSETMEKFMGDVEE